MISITKNTLLKHFAGSANMPVLLADKENSDGLKPASVLVPIIDESWG